MSPPEFKAGQVYELPSSTDKIYQVLMVGKECIFEHRPNGTESAWPIEDYEQDILVESLEEALKVSPKEWHGLIREAYPHTFAEGQLYQDKRYPDYTTVVTKVGDRIYYVYNGDSARDGGYYTNREPGDFLSIYKLITNPKEALGLAVGDGIALVKKHYYGIDPELAETI